MPQTNELLYIRQRMHELATAVQAIKTDTAVIKTKLQVIEESLEDYVTIDRFSPVQKIAYGIIAVFGGGIGAYLLTLLPSR